MAAQVAVSTQPSVIWQPNPGPQTRFLATRADEVMYGGQAGGGKSAALVAMPLRWVHHADFRAIILRRDTTQLGNLLDKAERLYRKAFPGAKFNANSQIWRFPSGAEIRYTHCQHEKDAARFDGDEFQLVGFDELTHFTLKQYQALGSRIRTTNLLLPRYIRGTTNPGGTGHDWVFERFGPWLNPECKTLPPKYDAAGKRIPPAGPGEVLYFLVDKEGNETIVPKGTPAALGRTFLPAKLSDTPQLASDPSYQQRLRNNDAVRRAQLEDGDWLKKPAAGEYFKRGWVPIVDVLPAGGAAVRAWDLAASVPTKDKPDPDWTVGVKLYTYPDGTFVVADVTRIRGTPGDVEKHIKATAELDGRDVAIRLPQDPAQAGKAQVAAYAKLLVGYSFDAAVMTGSKITRFGPFSSQCQAGNVRLLRGAWNTSFVTQLEQFPDGDHDDDADATSEAFNRRVSPRPPPPKPPPVRTTDFDSTPLG